MKQSSARAGPKPAFKVISIPSLQTIPLKNMALSRRSL
ncbi:hypothetical protein Cabys_3206 [Caldithrix abyssi DSM 13497]|uniref:Uncharacterized protein n=1 Tax=Caldithrix abyssi DSM 13497 TaxID=880073 RepID=A0A1J1CD88_CALAY|nr:hypothetical protein Cabys_3206 [Caldithrix abyssi DSM 13497]